MVTWDDVALRYGADKASSHHGYMTHYERLLGERDVTALLEIGVAGGRSLHMWAELFPEALIVGVDILAECRLQQRSRVAVICADAADPARMVAVATLHGPFDVVIDDGEHDPFQVRMAFEALYGHIRPGGLYVVEDLDPDAEWTQEFTARWGGEIIRCADDPVGCLIAIERR